MLIELISILSFLIPGSIMARLVGIKGWATPFIGFILGICLFITVGFVQIITPLPTWTLITMLVTFTTPFVLWVSLFRKFKLGFHARSTLIVIALIVMLVCFFRSMDVVNWSNDSYAYMASSALIADNQYEFDSINSISKRLLGTPLAHSPAQLGNENYLQSLSPLLSISTLAILAWSIIQGFNSKRTHDRWIVYVGSILGVLFLATNQRYIFNSFYISGHLLFSSLLLVIVASSWLFATKNSTLTGNQLVWLLTLVIPALVVTRPEASLVIAVAILPILLFQKTSPKQRAQILAVLGISTILWQTFLAIQYTARGASPPLSAVGLLLFGFALLLAIKIINNDLVRNKYYMILAGVELSLWTMFLILVIHSPAIAYKSVHSIYHNIFLGEGLWGLSLVILGYISLIVILLSRNIYLKFLRFPITTFLPLMLIVAYLRGGAYRVGAGDSFNRMLLHILPLIILYIIAGTISILSQLQEDNNNGARNTKRQRKLSVS